MLIIPITAIITTGTVTITTGRLTIATTGACSIITAPLTQVQLTVLPGLTLLPPHLPAGAVVAVPEAVVELVVRPVQETDFPN